MERQNIIDLTELGLSRLCDIMEPEIVDYNFSIGMLCRIIFFFISIIFRDLNTYTWMELEFQIVAWTVFHCFIICFEFQYLLQGESKTQQRELNYKYFDIIQTVIGMIYSMLNLESTKDKILFSIFTINLFVSVIQLFKECCNEEKKKNYSEQGGIRAFSIGIFIGTATVILYLFIIMGKYQSEIEASNLKYGYLFITIVGEIAGAFFSFSFMLIPSKKYETKKCSKGFLAFTYGLNFGFFSIFYGFIIGLVILIGAIYLCCTYRQESEYVHPTS